MDIKMLEMDGLQATQIIRQRWQDNSPKIIAVTAYALQGDRGKCIEQAWTIISASLSG